MTDQDEKKEAQEGSEKTEAPQHVTVEQLQSLLKTTLAPITKALSELQALKPEKQEAPESDDKITLKKMHAKLQALEEEKLNAHREKQEMELRSTVKDALTKAGIAPHLMKAAMAVLVDSDKRVQRNEDGDIVFKDDRFGDRSLDDGLRDFLRTEEGKSFLPPKGAKGSNDRRYTGSEVLPGKMSEEAAGEALRDLLLRGAQ